MQAAGGELVRWGHTEHLLAGVIDVLQVGNFLTTKAHFKGRPRQPKPIPRPGDKPDGKTIRSRRTYTIAELARAQKAWENQEAVETVREV